MPSATLDMARAEAFGQKMVGMVNQAGLALMVSLGHRTGLFDAMAGQPPATSAAIARAAGLSERYVREWLGAMVTGGVVEYDPSRREYSLPAEHAACLTRASRPNNLASVAQWIAVLGSAEDSVAEAFRHGQGVSYGCYHRFHEVMAEESNQTTVWGLCEHIIPLVDGMPAALQRGVDVLDVGCGSGGALLHMAQHYPASRFVGYDLGADAVASAGQRAAQLGLTNVRFEVHDAARMTETSAYDLVTAFDAIHDQAHPAAVLAHVARALRPGGCFLMQDIRASSHLHRNLEHPLGPFLYTISCMHCMSVSLSADGMGLGAVWGKETALAMLHDAGFRDVRVETLPHDMLNYYYLARKA